MISLRGKSIPALPLTYDLDLTNKDIFEDWFELSLGWKLRWKMRWAVRLSSRASYRLVIKSYPNATAIYDLT